MFLLTVGTTSCKISEFARMFKQFLLLGIWIPNLNFTDGQIESFEISLIFPIEIKS